MSDMNGKVKVAKLTVLGGIAVAALGLFGTVASIIVSRTSASGSDLKNLVVRHEATIEQMNKLIIPEIQKNFERLLNDGKEHEKVSALIRERLARLEGLIRGVPRRPRHARGGVGRPTVSGGSPATVGTKPETPVKRKIEIPAINVEQKPIEDEGDDE